MHKYLRAIIAFLLVFVCSPKSYALDFVNNVRDPIFAGGAIGNDVADDTAAINAAMNAAFSNGQPLYFPAGKYKMSSQWAILLNSVRTTGITIRGDGQQKSIIDLTSVSTSPEVIVEDTTTPGDNYYLIFKDIGIEGNTTGTVLQLGQSSYSDPVNEPEIDLWVVNGNTSSTASAVTINYVLNGEIRFVADIAGNGSAMILNQAAFNNFYGSYSSIAGYGIVMGGAGSFGNVFHSLDIENVAFCLVGNAPNNRANIFLSGEWSYNAAGVYTTAGQASAYMIINPNLWPWAPATNATFLGTSTIGVSLFNGSTGTNTTTAAANTFLAGPVVGGAALPSMRSIASSDLPLATGNSIGAVKPDGTTISVNSLGVISSIGGGGSSGSGLGVLPAARATGATQSVPSSIATLMQYKSVTFDNTSNYTASSAKFTAPVTGVYSVSAYMSVGETASNNYEILIYKNGSAYGYVDNNFGSNDAVHPISIDDMIHLLPGDYLQIYVFQDSGSARTFTLGSFSVHQVSN